MSEMSLRWNCVPGTMGFRWGYSIPQVWRLRLHSYRHVTFPKAALVRCSGPWAADVAAPPKQLPRVAGCAQAAPCPVPTWGPCLRGGEVASASLPGPCRRHGVCGCACAVLVGRWAFPQEGLSRLSRSTSFVCRLTLKGGSVVRFRLTPVVPTTLASTRCVSL